MQTVIMYQTFDGAMHKSKHDAEKHLDKIYGDKLLSLTRSMLDMNYTKMSDFIDVNLDEFVKLARIKDDFTLFNENED